MIKVKMVNYVEGCVIEKFFTNKLTTKGLTRFVSHFKKQGFELTELKPNYTVKFRLSAV